MIAPKRKRKYRKSMDQRDKPAPSGRIEGKQFEAIFEKHAKMQGFHVEKNFLPCRITPFGPRMIKKQEFCELDWKLIERQHGTVGFFDTKTFDQTHFIFSQIEEHQLKRAVFLNECHVPSGFVVWFRPIDAICFFTGQTIAAKGPGTRLFPGEGLYLGDMMNVSLGNLFL